MISYLDVNNWEFSINNWGHYFIDYSDREIKYQTRFLVLNYSKRYICDFRFLLDTYLPPSSACKLTYENKFNYINKGISKCKLVYENKFNYIDKGVFNDLVFDENLLTLDSNELSIKSKNYINYLKNKGKLI